jgi:iron(III) transport system permease protein
MTPAASAARQPSTRSPGPPRSLVAVAAPVAMLGILPVVYLVVLAAGGGEDALALLARERTLGVLARTLVLAGTVTLAAILVGVPVAWLTTVADIPGRRMWSVLTVLPLVIPSYVAGYAMVAAFGPRGAAQSLLEPLGVSRFPEIYGFPGAAATLTLFSFPYVVLAARGSLLGADPAYEEVSRSLGRGPWATFWAVTLPGLRPAIAAGALLVALYALSDFGAVSLLQFDSFTRAIFVQYRASFDPTLAAVLALLLVACTGGVLLAESRLRGRLRGQRPAASVRRPRRTVRLGRWRWPAVAFLLVVVSVTVVVPIATIGFWMARAAAAGGAFGVVADATLNSVVASTLAAVVVTAASVPVAILAVRHRGVVAASVERATYAGFALPGIVVGLAFVFVAARYVPWAYQSLALLLLAYVVRFAPEAVGVTRASLLQVSPRLEEAARTLGRRPLAVVRDVTLPMMRPGLLAGAALVFLTAMKELPTTVLLAPTGFDTLAMRIWSATSEGFFERAAAPALVMVVVAAASLAVVLRHDAAP